jgi:hypothetical protein
MRKRTHLPSPRDKIMIRVEVRREYHRQIKQLSVLAKTPVYKIAGQVLAAGMAQVRQRVKNDLVERMKREKAAKQTADPKISWDPPTEDVKHADPATPEHPDTEGDDVCAP